MGHRANLVVVDDDGWRLYYSHWVANGIYRRLAAGPDAALAFVRAQSPADPRDGWLDDVWSEGGALIDVPARRLLWYGNDWMIELPAWRVFRRVLAETWPGWRVDWAYDGIGDLAAHVGVDRAVVRNLSEDRFAAAPYVSYDLDELVRPDDAELPANEQGSYTLLTVRTDRLAAWVLSENDECQLAWLGPVWTHAVCPGLLPLDRRWPGWTVTFWRDGYEHQLAAAGGAVTVPACDEAAALDQLTGALAPESWDRPGPLAGFTNMVERERAAGKTVEVNPAAWQHTEVRPGETDRERLARALAKVAADLVAARPGA
jgi:hypothetical protein